VKVLSDGVWRILAEVPLVLGYRDFNIASEYLGMIVDDIKEDYTKVKWYTKRIKY
jgi:hypothetical protein